LAGLQSAGWEWGKAIRCRAYASSHQFNRSRLLINSASNNRTPSNSIFAFVGHSLPHLSLFGCFPSGLLPTGFQCIIGLHPSSGTSGATHHPAATASCACRQRAKRQPRDTSWYYGLHPCGFAPVDPFRGNPPAGGFRSDLRSCSGEAASATPRPGCCRRTQSCCLGERLCASRSPLLRWRTVRLLQFQVS
jgi:hypothetical protein